MSYEEGSTQMEEWRMAGTMKANMVAKLRENRGKLHWLHPSVTNDYLIDRLIEEVNELMKAETGEEAWEEAADVANFAAMIADKISKRA